MKDLYDLLAEQGFPIEDTYKDSKVRSWSMSKYLDEQEDTITDIVMPAKGGQADIKM